MTIMESMAEFNRNRILFQMGMISTLRSKGLSNDDIKELCSPTKIMLSIIRNVLPSIIANDIIGAQPMTGPIGQIHTLRVRYDRN